MGTIVEPTTTVPLVDPAIARRLRAIANKEAELSAEKVELILRARDEGATLREIAQHAGMTFVGIKKLIDRHRQ